MKSDKYKDISSSGWDIFLTCFIYSWDVGTQVPNDSEFFVCLSVWLVAYFLTQIGQKDVSCS